MDPLIEGDDRPAYAATIDSILDRYQTSMIERESAVGALSAIVHSLAPEELFTEEDADRLNIYFEVMLSRFRDGESRAARSEIQNFIRHASHGERASLARFRWDQY